MQFQMTSPITAEDDFTLSSYWPTYEHYVCIVIQEVCCCLLRRRKNKHFFILFRHRELNYPDQTILYRGPADS